MIGCLCRREEGRRVNRTHKRGNRRQQPAACSRPLMEPLLPTRLMALRGVLVLGVVEVIRLLSTSQSRRDFLAGASCCT